MNKNDYLQRSCFKIISNTCRIQKKRKREQKEKDPVWTRKWYFNKEIDQQTKVDAQSIDMKNIHITNQTSIFNKS